MILAYALTFATVASADELSIRVPQTAPGQEAILKLSYSVDCSAVSPGKPRLVLGFINVAGRALRADLFEATNQREVYLGNFDRATDLTLSYPGGSSCRVSALSAEVSVETLTDVLAHAPFLSVRDDQYENEFTDLPMSLVYNVETTDSGNRLIKYTMFFTDEDSKSSEDDTEGQMARYGRRTDVEWVYAVELDSAGRAVRGLYQGGFALISPTTDFGHSVQVFKGEFVSGTKHPILYNDAKNNVFSDSPGRAQRRKGIVGHHLVPRLEVKYPKAREWAMMQQPWMYKASDLELEAEGKLKAKATDYLYVLIDGSLSQGAFTVKLDLSNGLIVTSGSGEGDIDRLGEDMWKRQSFTALRIGRYRVNSMVTGHLYGKLSFEKTSTFRSPDLEVRKLRYFRIVEQGKSYVSEEITSKMLF